VVRRVAAFQGKDQRAKSEKTLRAYNYRFGFFLDFTAQQNLWFLDQIDRTSLQDTFIASWRVNAVAETTGLPVTPPIRLTQKRSFHAAGY